MQYDSRLDDGSDPLYAPSLSWTAFGKPRWTAPRRYVKAGYSVKSVALDGEKGDGQDEARAAACRRHTRDMLAWWTGQNETPAQDTWSFVIHRYRTDEFSTIHDVKANTRQGYLEQAGIWERIIGHMRVVDLTYLELRGILDAMRNKGRSPAYISRGMTHLRMLAKYASLIDTPGIDRVRTMLSDVRVQTPPKSSSIVTRPQIARIVAEADARGLHAFACGLLMQFELAVRAVDVRGQWLDSKNERGIWRNGKRWQDGMTWDMIDPDLTILSKTISKTAKSMPEPYHWDLTQLPEIRARLTLLRNGGAVGPVFTNADGLPYTNSGWTQAFNRITKALGITGVSCMDVRAGAITETKALINDPMLLRDAAQHRHVSTTDGYARARSDGANKVIELRRKG